MKDVFFKPNGGKLTVKAVFLGNIVADYEIYLKEKNSNAQTSILEGDNLNPEDDSTTLPTPPIMNSGRRVKLVTGFYGNNPSIDTKYEIKLEIYQGAKLIGVENEKGELNGKAQFSLLMIKLNESV